MKRKDHPNIIIAFQLALIVLAFGVVLFPSKLFTAALGVLAIMVGIFSFVYDDESIFRRAGREWGAFLRAIGLIILIFGLGLKFWLPESMDMIHYMEAFFALTISGMFIEWWKRPKKAP